MVQDRGATGQQGQKTGINIVSKGGGWETDSQRYIFYLARYPKDCGPRGVEIKAKKEGESNSRPSPVQPT